MSEQQHFDDSPLEQSVSEDTAKRINRGLYLVLLVLLVVVAAVIASQVIDTAPPVSPERLAKEAVIGADDAPIQLIEYGAYGCVFCRTAEQSGAVRQILQTYADDIQFRFRNWPRRTDNDPLAAQAAQCALDQSDEAFWTLHNTLYALSDGEFRATDNIDELVAITDGAGLDGGAMRDCLENKTHKRTVDHWNNESEDQNVVGTPTFFVNGRAVFNVADVEAIIEEELGS